LTRRRRGKEAMALGAKKGKRQTTPRGSRRQGSGRLGPQGIRSPIDVRIVVCGALLGVGHLQFDEQGASRDSA
jgi:hypothetical protein